MLPGTVRVDFYVLSSKDPKERLALVCKLVDKATTHGQKVFVHSDDEPLLQSLDEYLWHFRPDRFIAHRLIHSPNAVAEATSGSLNAELESLEPVTLSSADPAHSDAVFINLASRVPAFFSRFERTLEVIDQQESVRLDGRIRYRFYQDRGYPLQHHNL